MVRLLIILGVVLVIALVVFYVVITLNAQTKAKKSKRTMTNNEYDNYPQD